MTGARPARRVAGPNGPLTLADLPPPDLPRWVAHRKAEVVAAVRGGLITLDDACGRYCLTQQEFLAWERRVDLHGLPGLRATCAQKYRLAPPRN